MSGFADLVRKAQPALLGGGCAASASAGRSWEWRFDDIVDDDGNPIDMATGITAECKVVTEPGGAEVVDLVYVGGLGSFVIGQQLGYTTGLFVDGDKSRGRVCSWYLTLITDSGYEVQAWMVDNSPFSIRRGA